MSSLYRDVKSIEFYRYNSTFCEAILKYAPGWNTKYIGLYKESDYTSAPGEKKHSRSYVLYTIPAAKKLLEVLGQLINDADNFTGVYDFPNTQLFLISFK